MAIERQDNVVCRRPTQLRANTFKHNNSIYKCIGWNTSREDANKGIVQYTDQAQITLPNDVPESIDLYAVWKERDLHLTYENLRISANNVKFNEQTTTISYSIDEVKYYEETDIVYSRKSITGTRISESFGTNGVAGSEIKTNALTRHIKFDFVGEDGNTYSTTTDITQYGYTPTYRIRCVKTLKGNIECYQNGNKLTSTESAGLIEFSSTVKEFTLKAIPSKIESFDYLFNKWKDGKTTAQIVVQGAVQNVPEFEAEYKLAPLMKNTVIGTWRKTWTTYTTKSVAYTYYTSEKYYWQGTCGTDHGKRGPWPYGTAKHVNWPGHGYWTYHNVAHTGYKNEDVPTSHKNIYYGANSIAAPYTFTIPEDGILSIKGKFGVLVYGCTCTRIGGFKILKYNSSYDGWDDFLTFKDTIKNTDISFERQINVKKGEKYQFSKCFSTTLEHIAVWIDTIELDANPKAIVYDPNVLTSPIALDDIQDKDVKSKLMNIFDNNAKTDYSIKVASAGKMQRDIPNEPHQDTEFINGKQTVLKIAVAGGGGWGYSQQLTVVDATNNKKIKNIIATGTDWQGARGDLDTKICYVYVPSNRKIKINARWSSVDTQHFNVFLDIKGVSFDKL